jgi:hypothetical protein
MRFTRLIPVLAVAGFQSLHRSARHRYKHRHDLDSTASQQPGGPREGYDHDE